jgi:hypothetical protein
LEPADEKYKTEMLARLQKLNETFIKGKTVSGKQEMIWSFVQQVMGGYKLSDKQTKILGEWEYLADTEGKGWEFNRGKSFKAAK